ncbi:hypothetical protein GCM10023190_20130 [Enteractinococcus fodinae]
MKCCLGSSKPPGPSYLVLSSGNFMIQVAYGVLPWVVAVWLLRHYDSETLTKRVSGVPEAA